MLMRGGNLNCVSVLSGQDYRTPPKKKEDALIDKRKGKGTGGIVIAILLAAGMPACLVPPFSSLQDARLAGKGKVELTPFGTAVSPFGQNSQTDLGLQLLWGVSRKLDLGFRYEYLFSPGGDEGYDQDVSAHTFAAGPKVSLIRSHVALFLPVGFAVGGSVGSELIWEFQPTAIFTVPISGSVDLNASAKGLIPLNRDRDTLCAVDLGLGFRPGRGSWNFRPEIGILFNPKGGGSYFQASLGLSYRLGK